jgi:hypothetical protein
MPLLEGWRLQHVDRPSGVTWMIDVACQHIC